MNRDDIIRMAREAGLYVDEDGEILEGDGWHTQTLFIERFAALAYEAGRKDENEACAKVCEAEGERSDVSWVSCAFAIRKRGAP